MLDRLYIENIAVIEKAEIEFDKGFNVLTGETGAGKSIVIDSINAVLGGRTSRELLRTGAQKAFVSAEFSDICKRIAHLAENMGFPAEEDGLILSREIKEDGKTSCRINGRPATVSQLKELGKQLINIHGQHETTELLDASTHIRYVDAAAENEDIKKEYFELFSQYNRIEAQLNALDKDKMEKERLADSLRYQINELEKANLTPGEYDELSSQCIVLQNFEQINDAFSSCRDMLCGDENTNGACSDVASACSELDSISDVCPAAEQLSKRLTDLSYELEDISMEVRNELSSMEFEPELLNEMESRLSSLEKLFKRYGDEKQAIEYLENAKTQLASIENSDELKIELTQKLKEKKNEAQVFAEKITLSRKKAAEKLSKDIQRELAYLDMPSVIIDVEINRTELSEDGWDSVEFLISTNTGEPPKPLAKIASGGELSRIMLAFKTVLADKDDIDTLIFDEIDTGISGKASNKVGEKLRQVSECRQIICVTHSAQIAAKGDQHMFIKKSVENGRTSTKINVLSFDERKYELARIIGGESITDSVLAAASEMLRR